MPQMAFFFPKVHSCRGLVLHGCTQKVILFFQGLKPDPGLHVGPPETPLPTGWTGPNFGSCHKPRRPLARQPQLESWLHSDCLGSQPPCESPLSSGVWVFSSVTGGYEQTVNLPVICASCEAAREHKRAVWFEP